MPFFLSFASLANGVVWTAYACIRFDPFITVNINPPLILLLTLKTALTAFFFFFFFFNFRFRTASGRCRHLFSSFSTPPFINPLSAKSRKEKAKSISLKSSLTVATHRTKPPVVWRALLLFQTRRRHPTRLDRRWAARWMSWMRGSKNQFIFKKNFFVHAFGNYMVFIIIIIMVLFRFFFSSFREGHLGHLHHFFFFFFF